MTKDDGQFTPKERKLLWINFLLGCVHTMLFGAMAGVVVYQYQLWRETPKISVQIETAPQPGEYLIRLSNLSAVPAFGLSLTIDCGQAILSSDQTPGVLTLRGRPVSRDEFVGMSSVRLDSQLLAPRSTHIVAILLPADAPAPKAVVMSPYGEVRSD